MRDSKCPDGGVAALSRALVQHNEHEHALFLRTVSTFAAAAARDDATEHETMEHAITGAVSSSCKALTASYQVNFLTPIILILTSCGLDDPDEKRLEVTTTYGKPPSSVDGRFYS